jgi:hypothetical protein
MSCSNPNFNNGYYRLDDCYGYAYIYGYGPGYGTYPGGFIQGCNIPSYYSNVCKIGPLRPNYMITNPYYGNWAG